MLVKCIYSTTGYGTFNFKYSIIHDETADDITPANIGISIRYLHIIFLPLNFKICAILQT